MIENLTKQRLAAGETVSGCFLRYPSASLAEYVALAGWDFLVFDGEHGPLQPHHLEDLSRAAELRGVTPLARVTTNQASVILRFLDAGVHGVHVPWVNSAEQAELAVRAVKYHPRGQRGLAGSRASDWGMTGSVADYVDRANAETLVVLHIETAQAVEAAPGLAAVEDVDVLFLGPSDLSHSLGHPGRKDHPEVAASLERAADAVLRSGKVLGIFAGSATMAREWQERGARYLATGLEGMLGPAMGEFVHAVRG